jgi:hypothetical protein
MALWVSAWRGTPSRSIIELLLILGGTFLILGRGFGAVVIGSMSSGSANYPTLVLNLNTTAAFHIY